MKTRIEEITSQSDERRRVFDAAKAGNTAAVRRALDRGFDPATADADGRTLYQIAKDMGFGDIEILA
ncbi:ankyrin repeat domain-containing protein, partial [Streptomyces brasiliscabiei]|uniref:ankyrin repeat domain-containing protein n=1 Tax=Streptomyces brasiliscabiei TaxID=2736302 RepID=UPI003014F22C